MNECLFDKERTEFFKRAIQRVVKRGDVVMDAGTGSGIMALFAAQAGADKVYAIDIAEDVAAQAKKNVHANHMENTIDVMCQDIKTLHNLRPIDVLIMEMMDTGLVSEQQAVAVNNLHLKKIIHPDTRMIPYKVDNTIEAIQYDFSFYGFTMPFIIQARNDGADTKVVKKLSDRIIYRSIDFRKTVNTEVDEVVTIPITQDGTINAIRILTKAYLSDEISVWNTSDMNMPVIIPVRSQKVQKGDKVHVSINYKMGYGFGSFAAVLL